MGKKGGYNPRGSGPMPTRFRCKVGGEWKSINDFAPNQHKFIQRQRESGQKIDAANSGMTCRDHSSKPKQEFRCELCGLIKHADEFSKTSRRNDVWECKRCTAWRETQEPNVTPVPLETGHISVEEENSEAWSETFTHSGDFFGEEAMPKAPITSFTSLGISDSEVEEMRSMLRETSLNEALETGSLSGVSSSDACGRLAVPPHLAQRLPTDRYVAKSVVDDRASEVSRRAPAIPPHLRHTIDKAPTSVASDLGSSKTSGSSRQGDGYRPPHLRGRGYASSMSTATTVRDATGGRKFAFNAWDSSGKKHSAVKQPTVVSSSASSVTASDSIAQAEEWPALPTKMPTCRPNSQWPKASEMKIPQSELKKQPVITHISARYVDPAIEKQRRMVYCDSDDDEY